MHAGSGYPAAWPPDPAAFIAPPGGDAWVAELADQMPVQVLLRRPQDSPERSWEALTGHPTASLALVSRLFVHPGAAGQGAARALLGTAVRTARQCGLVPALDVHAQS